MTAALTSGRYIGSYGDLSIQIDILNVSYTSTNTGVFAALCNFYGDNIQINGTFVAPNPGTAQGAIIKMLSSQSTGTRVSALNIEFIATDPIYSSLEGNYTVHFTNGTWGTNYMNVRRV